VRTADAGPQPLVELDRARLLEQVDDRVGVTAEGDPAGCGSDSVGEVALGRGAHAHERVVALQQRAVVLEQVGGVDRGERRRLEYAGLGEGLRRGVPVALPALLVLSGLLGDVGVQRPAMLGGSSCDRARAVRIDGADAVDRRADSRSFAGCRLQPADALRPCGCVCVAERR
jgi:hypothetical protein